MEGNEDSVFGLLTKLCELHCKRPSKVRHLRSSCYEAFLGKRMPQDPRYFRDLKGATNPTTCILAWCCRLSHEFDRRESSLRLMDGLENFKSSYYGDQQSQDSILRFLYLLRDLPPENEDKLDLSIVPKIDDKMINFEKLFKFPAAMSEEFDTLGPLTSGIKVTESHFSLRSMPVKSQSSFGISETIVQQVSRSQSNLGTGSSQLLRASKTKLQLIHDEGYGSPTKDRILEVAVANSDELLARDRILEIASERDYSEKRSWENYGYLEPQKEKPFLSELGEVSSLWVENLESLYLRDNFSNLNTINVKIKPKKEVLRDLKYLLIGLPSNTFPVNPQNVFYLLPGVMIESITPDTLEKYCQTFLFCGACCRGLVLMSTKDPHTRKYKHAGYVFTEFCDTLSRYLQFYRQAVLSISDTTCLLEFDEKTYQLRRQISTLASICKVGPYVSETEEIPHGVALLNYLHQQVLGLSDTNLYMVLYSILYPCCQIYFSRFLHQWIFKGSINDQYGEFFVGVNLKYVNTRGRTYWTRSYEIREDLIPDFLVDLKDEILFCGKMMNLLELCVPNNKLCIYLRGETPVMLTCCLTSDQLGNLGKNASRYFLEASTECGSKFDLGETLRRQQFQDSSVINLMAKKRATTLKRLELERQKAALELHEKKMEELQMLREQYQSALEQKELKISREIGKEIRNVEEILDIEKMRDQLIAEEAEKIIHFYSQLWESANNRKKKVEQYLDTVRNLNIDTNIEKENNLEEKINSSTESFHSVPEIMDEPKTTLGQPTIVKEKSDENIKTVDSEEENLKPLHNATSLDLLNANTESKSVEKLDNIEDPIDTQKAQNQANFQQALDNFETAKKIRLKVLSQDYNILAPDSKKVETLKDSPKIVATLTAAQRNKLKVLSSEFGIDVINKNLKVDNVLTIAQINRNKVLATNECFSGDYTEKRLDNEAFLKKETQKFSTDLKKSKSLMLDLKPSSKTFDKVVPMSVDSTPLSELPQSATPMSEIPPSVTPSTTYLSVETRMDSLPSTSNTILTDSNVFQFEMKSQEIDSSGQVTIFSKRVTPEEAAGITTSCLKLFLTESVSIPLSTQKKLVNNELLRFFIEDLSYLKHLGSLRDYFFLQDGEFGRSITENLFEKLYDANFPLELINCRTLQHLVFNALDSSSKFQENSQFLSFKINSLPKCFDLGNPDVLDCLSMTYKVRWPLNILLPSDTVAKYDQVFKYLVKLNRVSWVLKKIFLQLKILAKETGKKEIYLMSSPQYKRLHQCRHVMLHFVQTLQNYVVGEVLQPTWVAFEKTIAQATNLDDLYTAHTAYIKDILSRCHLNQKTMALRNIIQKIFTVILKFYDYLRSRSWKCQEGQYIHPNFTKLEKIFKNFEEFAIYLIKVIRKVAKRGYQPHLVQFLDILDVNSFYSRQILETQTA